MIWKLTPIDWGALATIVTTITAFAAFAATHAAVKGLKKSEKSTRVNMVRDLDQASREMLYALVDVRTEVYKCVEVVREIEKSKGKEESRAQTIPSELITACVKFGYTCELLLLRKMDFSGHKNEEDHPMCANFHYCVLVLQWLSYRIYSDFGSTESINKKNFAKYFEKSFVNGEGNSSYVQGNKTPLKIMQQDFNRYLDGLLIPYANPRIIESDPLFILVVAELMQLFVTSFIYYYDKMLEELGLHYSTLYDF